MKDYARKAGLILSTVYAHLVKSNKNSPLIIIICNLTYDTSPGLLHLFSGLLVGCLPALHSEL